MSENIIDRINAALKRMESEGHNVDDFGNPCEHYENLKAKRDAIANGASYATYYVAPYLISYLGAHIPDVNFKRDKVGNHVTVKGRGNKHEATLNAVIQIAHLRNEV